MSVKPNSPFERRVYEAAELRFSQEARNEANREYTRLYAQGLVTEDVFTTANTAFTPSYAVEREPVGTMTVTTETKAILEVREGKVVGIVKGSEPGVISLATTGNRAVMTPDEADALAVWLTGTAKSIREAAHAPLRNDNRVPGPTFPRAWR